MLRRRSTAWRRLSAAAAAILLSLVSVPAPATAATSTNVLKTWAPKYMNRSGTMTAAIAVRDASTFDLIVAKPKTYAPFVADMRAANPRLVLLAYFNGTFAGSSDGDAYPATWYVRDPYGNQVKSVRWGNYMMNPASTGWIGNRRETCQDLVASSGYDGCSLDVLGTTPVTSADFVTGTPINPATGRPWTPAEWLTATSGLADAVRDFVGAPVYGNGIGDGPRYFDPVAPSSALFTGVDGGMAEGFLRSGRAPLDVFPTLDEWKANVDMLVDAGSRGRRLIVVTKSWNTGTSAQKNALHKFALASFLLGNDGRSRFSFLYDESLDPAAGHPWWKTRLGSPTGAYAALGTGAYARGFVNGKVVVNPSTNPVSVPLGGTFTTLDGQTVSTVTLAPHSGEVLTG